MSVKWIATFHPQAWIGDQAVEVDPEGETKWDVTGKLESMSEKDRQEALVPESYEADALRYAEKAPAWATNWYGPFYIEVEERS